MLDSPFFYKCRMGFILWYRKKWKSKIGTSMNFIASFLHVWSWTDGRQTASTSFSFVVGIVAWSELAFRLFKCAVCSRKYDCRPCAPLAPPLPGICRERRSGGHVRNSTTQRWPMIEVANRYRRCQIPTGPCTEATHTSKFCPSQNGNLLYLQKQPQTSPFLYEAKTHRLPETPTRSCWWREGWCCWAPVWTPRPFLRRLLRWPHCGYHTCLKTLHSIQIPRFSFMLSLCAKMMK